MTYENEQKLANAAKVAASAFDRLVTLLENIWEKCEKQMDKKG